MKNPSVVELNADVGGVNHLNQLDAIGGTAARGIFQALNSSGEAIEGRAGKRVRTDLRGADAKARRISRWRK